MRIDSVNPRTIYAGTFGGLFKSTDAGETWSVMSLQNGLGLPPSVTAIAIDRSDDAVVYVTVFNSGFYKSTDAGGTWTQMVSGMANRNATGLVASASAAPKRPRFVLGGDVPETAHRSKSNRRTIRMSGEPEQVVPASRDSAGVNRRPVVSRGVRR